MMWDVTYIDTICNVILSLSISFSDEVLKPINVNFKVAHITTHWHRM